MARPRIALTQKDLTTIERLAGTGMPLEEIAHVLGFSADTMSRRKTDTEAVANAVARGRAKARGDIGTALLRKAKRGDVPAIRWFEATRFGLSEKHSLEHTGKDGGVIAQSVTVRFVRPGDPDAAR